MSWKEESNEKVAAAVKVLFHEINAMGSGKRIAAVVKEEFGKEHNTLQQAFFKNFIVPVIDQMADTHKSKWTDLRNEASGEFAVKLQTITKDTALPCI